MEHKGTASFSRGGRGQLPPRPPRFSEYGSAHRGPWVEEAPPRFTESFVPLVEEAPLRFSAPTVTDKNMNDMERRLGELEYRVMRLELMRPTRGIQPLPSPPTPPHLPLKEPIVPEQLEDVLAPLH